MASDSGPLPIPTTVFPFPLYSPLLCLVEINVLVVSASVIGQEEFELLHLEAPNSHGKQPSVGVSLSEADLALVSSTVLAAETWLRSHVLSRYPSTRITAIIVGKGFHCNKSHERQWDFLLPTVKNLHYSLMRWGLVKEIQVSAGFSADCLPQHSRDALKPILTFLQESGSTYAIDEPSYSANQNAWKRLGFSELKGTRVVRESRKLSSFASPSFAEMPKPGGLQVPSHLAKKPSTPPTPTPTPTPIPFPPPSDGSFTFPPDASPALGPPANPPDVFPATPPPCLATPAAPAPGSGAGPNVGLWCVAKPTVPMEKLQEAMDYACGGGGADCAEIGPDGSCYYPDNVVAHASYAFNSYWQKTKQSGGSCSFDGTAVLINSDPTEALRDYDRCIGNGFKWIHEQNVPVTRGRGCIGQATRGTTRRGRAIGGTRGKGRAGQTAPTEPIPEEFVEVEVEDDISAYAEESTVRV
ncbi:glucan endo-1,3-beta-glucosidase 7 [Canna indica]|uniref:Glucan endo-1,3-beta-glucosidase 7 n=1 Tax=Canna indica TaxID=4628 RepID=A0AAQ3K3Z6_9LILI|nr:glucan endo-1,3-beta-glucosidase 7 [Canna indica]